MKELNNLSFEELSKLRTRILFNLGTYHLWRDDFQTGLRLFLFKGEELDYWKKVKLPFTFWKGGIMPGRTIILHAEAGIGDEFINIRFMKHLRDLGMKPVWLTDRNKDLCALYKRSGFDVITDKRELTKIDNPLWTHPMSLPVYLDLQYKDLWYGPYLTPIVTNKLPNNKLKIGIRWQGNPEYDHDLHRSVPLKEIYGAVKHIDADFYSLQKDTGLEEMADFPGLIDMNHSMKTFDDTLSLMNELDLVISTCTSVLHGAAAMGKKVYALIPISAYYTWSHSTKQSPWYGENVTIFRQTAPRVWHEPLEELKNRISELTNSNKTNIE